MNDILPFSAKTHTFEIRFGSFAAIEIISKMFYHYRYHLSFKIAAEIACGKPAFALDKTMV